MDDRGKQIRRDTLALSKANGGYHYGGCFSCVEILIALFDYVMGEHDKFILSKGHSCWPYYVLLRERGLNPKLEGHPHCDPHNGILCTTGSLGHGLPSGVGMAMAKKYMKRQGTIYVLMGDGECQEGTTWESLLIAGRHELDNLVVIVDYNKIQGSGFVHEILGIRYPLEAVAEKSGWEFMELDGHSWEELTAYLQGANCSSKPILVLAHTVKGKGVSYMENNPKWHACWPDPDHEAQALKELS